MRRFVYLLAIMALALIPLLPVKAADFRNHEDTIAITDSETPKDLYVAAGSVSVDTNVIGDLVAAGGTVLVDGEIDNSLFVAGGTVTVRGVVNRNARIAGGTVTISGLVRGDLLVAGGTVIITSTAEIEGDLILSAGNAVVEGSVHGKTVASGGSLTFKGSYSSLRLYTDEARILKGATVSGDLTYTSASSKSVVVDPEVTVGGKTEFIPRASAVAGTLTIGFLLKVASAVLVGWLMLRFFGKTLAKTLNGGFEKPWRTLGLGVIGLILVPIAAMILIFTFIGTGIAALILAQWVILMLLGSVVGKIAFGAWAYRLIAKEKTLRVDLTTAAVGIIALSFIFFIPVIGPLITALFFLFGFGSVINLWLKLTDQFLSKA